MIFKTWKKYFVGPVETDNQPEAIIIPPSWQDVRSVLPKMFQNVIVWGRLKERNVCHQAWEARRWTGCTSGFDVEKDKCWDWITPTDYPLKDVTHWFPLPDVILVPDSRWTQTMEGYRIKNEIEKFGKELVQKS